MSDGIGNWLAGGAAGLFPAADLMSGAVPLIPATSSQALYVQDLVIRNTFQLQQFLFNAQQQHEVLTRAVLDIK